MIKIRALLRSIFLWAIAAFLLIPFAIVAGVSLNPARQIAFPPKSVSGAWFVEMVTDRGWQVASWNSFSIAFIAAMLATSVALLAAYALWRRDTWLSRSVFALGLAPYMVPPIILALGASVFWAEVGLYGSRWATTISHGVLFVTLPLVIISRGFSVLNREIVDASNISGASPTQTFTRVILPIIAPYVVTSFAIVAIISVNEYLISSFISGFTVETLPIKIFNNVRYGYTPVLAAAAIGFAAVTVGVLVLVSFFTDLVELFGGSAPEDLR